MSIQLDVSDVNYSRYRLIDLEAIINLKNASNSSSSMDDPSKTYSTALFKAPLWQTHLNLAVIYCCLTMFIIIVGTFGNVAIIIINAKDKSMNNIGRIFIINIAIGDLCVSSFAEPLCIVGTYVYLY